MADKTNKEADLLAMMMDSPRISITEFLQKEKQIMIDPLSLKESSIQKTTMVQPTIITTNSTSPTLLHPPTLKPPKLRFLSLSLPNSSISSPKFASNISIKKSSKGEGSPESQYQASNNLSNKLHNLLQEVHLRKSKSYGEGRESSYGTPPLEDFDHWLGQISAKENDKWEWHHPSFTKNDAVNESPKSVKHVKTSSDSDDGFKCSSLCLYLPSFIGKIKQVKTRKGNEADICRTVSLENFECGSWASATMFHDTDGESNNSYFDLPMELIHYSATEVYSPVAASFVYEEEVKVKGVLKNGSSRNIARKSDLSPRHVRFSISSSASNPASPAASCISPRLRKAREDFNAFLSAQTA